ncbi:MAG: hypothetical protein GY833_12075 [Aestuariibacter sp.]|nr:hypothetical protein [Aestuariibacter sp.]|tara:strand:- start:8429 stop:8902 length:474 start_codon:yes stop_codon:yes gene_type:complete
MSFLVIDTDKYSAEAIDRIRAAMAAEDIVEEPKALVVPEQNTLYASIFRALNPKSDCIDPNSESARTLDDMMPVGKRISLSVEIVNTDRAQMLFGTMYDKYSELFGIRVHSWGAYDILKAQEERLKTMSSLHDEFYAKLQDLRHTDDRVLLETEKIN